MKGKSLIVSDIDNTLIYREQNYGLEVFKKIIDENREDVILVYSSGRKCNSILKSLQNTPQLPSPDYIIGGVGTEIMLFPYKLRDKEYTKLLSHNWDEKFIRVVMKSLSFTLQPKQFQSHFKISYYANPTLKPLENTKRLLQESNINAQVIYSSNRDLDIIPINAGKGNSASYIQQIEKISKHRVFVIGDSLNDKSMFRKHYNGIIVGNASPSLKKQKSDENYVAKNPGIMGVIEGLLFWKPFPIKLNKKIVENFG